MDKFQVARGLNDIATLLALSGESRFKVRAYRRAALSVEATGRDLSELIDNARLTELEQVGPAIARTIAELWLTGRSSLFERLAAALPPGSLELCRVPGLTVRRVRALHQALGVRDLRELRLACEQGRVRKVAGFGERTERRILEAIRAFLNRPAEVTLSQALTVAERLADYMRASNVVEQIEPAGDVRRRVETTSELELVVLTNDADAARAHFAAYPGFIQASVDGSGRLPNGLRVTLHVAGAETYAATLLVETGPAAHLELLTSIAGEQGRTAPPGSEFAKLLADARSESEIYSRLRLKYVPPEVRDEADLTAARAHELPELIADADLCGALHCHTIYSDGRATIEEMAVAAQELGMSYISITDHSQSAYYAGGVSVDRLKQQWDEIDAVQERVGIRILKGTESDILADGSLDYPDAALERLDIVIASVHGRLRMDAKEMTRRLERAMRHPFFKIWGHALGRLLLRRPPFACDVERVLEVIAESRAAIEINGDPHRLDLEPLLVRRAKRLGIKFVISTDAHSTRGLAYQRYGVMMARRGGLSVGDVLNTLGSTEFLDRVRPVGG